MGPETRPNHITLSNIARQYYLDTGTWPSAHQTRDEATQEAIRRRSCPDPLLNYFDRIVESSSGVTEPSSVLPSPPEALARLNAMPVITVRSLDEWTQLSTILGLDPSIPPTPNQSLTPSYETRAYMLARHINDLLTSRVDPSTICTAVRALAGLSRLDPAFTASLQWLPNEKGLYAFDALRDILNLTIPHLQILIQSADNPKSPHYNQELAKSLSQVYTDLLNSADFLNLQSQNRWAAARYEFPGNVEDVVPPLVHSAVTELESDQSVDVICNNLLLALIARRLPLSEKNISKIFQIIQKASPDLLLPFAAQIRFHNIARINKELLAKLGIEMHQVNRLVEQLSAPEDAFSVSGGRFFYVETGGFNWFHRRHTLNTLVALDIIRSLHGSEGRVIVQPWTSQAGNARGLYPDHHRFAVALLQLQGFTGSDLWVTLDGQPDSTTRPEDHTKIKFRDTIPTWLINKGAPDNFTLGRITGLEKIHREYPLLDLPHILLVSAPNPEQTRDPHYLLTLDRQIKTAFGVLQIPPVLVFLPCPEYRGENLRKILHEAGKGKPEAYERACAMLSEPTVIWILKEYYRPHR